LDTIVIKGGRPLYGDVTVSGAKNSALPIMVATLLSSGVSTITGVPNLSDIRTMKKLFEHFGVVFHDSEDIVIDTADISGFEAPYDLVRTMRASFLVLGPLVARFGKARVSLPGGCAIGLRPVDIHIKALEAMGVKIEIDEGYVIATCSQLKGAHVILDLPTVGGTENILIAASLAHGTTIIENAAREPEIIDLAHALRKMGARINGEGTDTIEIEGVNKLEPLEFHVMPDRIEAGTLMVAGAIAGGQVRIKNCPVHSMGSIIEKLKEAGIDIEHSDTEIFIKREGLINPVEITTNPHPGFPTDMQAQMMALLSLAEGASIIRETIFENRFIHVAELDRMGAKIKVERDTAVVVGVKQLHGASVMATDLRASASLILAGLAAQGPTVISRVYHLDRGYDCLESKLQGLGADICRKRAE